MEVDHQKIGGKFMKKCVSLFLTVAMAISLTACGQANAGTGDGTNTEVSGKNTDQQAETTTSEGSETGMDDKTVVADAGASEEAPENSSEESSKILVAYFSATNTTKGVAETLAEDLHADLYEIVPANPYTADDLNYNDKNSRTSLEMNDASARPEIANAVENMDHYDVVFVGYPIWWGKTPRIMSTFMEQYDFSGKTLIPFCTSASSGIGSSASELEKLTDGAVWLDGHRFSGSDSKDTIAEWVNGLGLE